MQQQVFRLVYIYKKLNILCKYIMHIRFADSGLSQAKARVNKNITFLFTLTFARLDPESVNRICHYTHIITKMNNWKNEKHLSKKVYRGESSSTD